MQGDPRVGGRPKGRPYVITNSKPLGLSSENFFVSGFFV